MIDREYSLAELMITAAAEAWRDDGEIMVSSIGPLPRLAASLAKVTFNPALQTTDGDALYTSQPVPPGPRAGYVSEIEGLATYDRLFSTLWSGKRHAMVTPVQIDRFGQTNISMIGDYARPRAALLGVRGFPGNSMHHPNSFFFTSHNTRAFVPGEVDYVCSAGYNPKRYRNGVLPAKLDLRLIVTDLAVLDFGGADHAIRVCSLHPGVSFEQVQDNTGFALLRPDHIPLTPEPTASQLAIIARLDPNQVRKTVLKDNPPGNRRAA